MSRHLVVTNDGPFLCNGSRDGVWTYRVDMADCVPCLRAALASERAAREAERAEAERREEGYDDLCGDLQRRLIAAESTVEALRRTISDLAGTLDSFAEMETAEGRTHAAAWTRRIAENARTAAASPSPRTTPPLDFTCSFCKTAHAPEQDCPTAPTPGFPNGRASTTPPEAAPATDAKGSALGSVWPFLHMLKQRVGPLTDDDRREAARLFLAVDRAISAVPAATAGTEYWSEATSGWIPAPSSSAAPATPPEAAPRCATADCVLPLHHRGDCLDTFRRRLAPATPPEATAPTKHEP